MHADFVFVEQPPKKRFRGQAHIHEFEILERREEQRKPLPIVDVDRAFGRRLQHQAAGAPAGFGSPGVKSGAAARRMAVGNCSDCAK